MSPSMGPSPTSRTTGRPNKDRSVTSFPLDFPLWINKAINTLIISVARVRDDHGAALRGIDPGVYTSTSRVSRGEKADLALNNESSSHFWLVVDLVLLSEESVSTLRRYSSVWLLSLASPRSSTLTYSTCLAAGIARQI